MHIFFIILAAVAFFGACVFSVSATFTVIYDSKWKTTVKILWVEKEIKLSKLLSFVLFPEKAADEVKGKKTDKKNKNKENQKSSSVISKPDEVVLKASEKKDNSSDVKQQQIPAKKPEKQNYFKKILNRDGIVGILLFVSNMLQTAESALGTLFRGFHIYSLYVKIITGGSDAAEIAKSYGTVCKYYYPLKGVIINGMKVDNYDDLIVPDFIAPCNEYGLQFIGSISLGLLFRVLTSAGKTFLVNLLKNK